MRCVISTSPHVVRVGPGAAQQQALPPDRLARQRLPRGGVLAPPRDAELAAAQLRAEPIPPHEVRVDDAGDAQDGGVLPALPALLLPLLGVAVRGAARAVAAGDGDDGGAATPSVAKHLQLGGRDGGVATTHV